jgi:hypothetical protein
MHEMAWILRVDDVKGQMRRNGTTGPLDMQTALTYIARAGLIFFHQFFSSFLSHPQSCSFVVSARGEVI